MSKSKSKELNAASDSVFVPSPHLADAPLYSIESSNLFVRAYIIVNNLGLQVFGKFWVLQYFGPIYPGAVAHKRSMNASGTLFGFQKQFHNCTVVDGKQASTFFQESGITDFANKNGGICTFWIGWTPAIYQSTNLPLVSDKHLEPSTGPNQGLFGSFMGTFPVDDPERKEKRRSLVTVLGNVGLFNNYLPAINAKSQEYLESSKCKKLSLEVFARDLVAYVDSHIPGILDLTIKPLTEYCHSDKYGELLHNFFDLASDVISKMDKQAGKLAGNIVPLVREILLDNFDSIEAATDRNIFKQYFAQRKLPFTRDAIKSANEDLIKEIGTILIATYDTTSLSFYWALTFIENNEYIKQKVIEEACSGNPPKNLDYISLVVLETIRIAGNNPTALWRRVNVPFRFDKNNCSLYVRSNTMLWLDRRNANSDRTIFPNPHTFNPDNIMALVKSDEEKIESLLSHNRYEINSFSMVNTFNNPRKCPGRFFSVYVQTQLIRNLYSKFTVSSYELSTEFRRYSAMPKPVATAQICIEPKL